MKWNLGKFRVHITLVIEITEEIIPILTFLCIVFPYALPSPFIGFRFSFPFHHHYCLTCLHSLLKIHSLHCVHGAIFCFAWCISPLTGTYAIFVSRGAIFVSYHWFCGFIHSIFTFTDFARVHLTLFAFTGCCLLPYFRVTTRVPSRLQKYVFYIFEMLYLYAWNAFCMLWMLSIYA